MAVDRAIVDLRGVTPDAVEQLGARKHASRLFQQILQQTELGRSEIELAFAAPDPKRFAIKLGVAGVEASGDPLGATTAQERADSRHQLGDQERLDDVIVGTNRK